jgi:hypothetical protein
MVFTMRTKAFILVALLIPGLLAAQSVPKTRAELSNYEETSRYDDVIKFIADLGQLTPLMRVEMFGRTNEGRDLPLMILSNPPVSSPRQAIESSKPIVFVMANIHAGEVEGKEAALVLARRLTTGDLKPLLDKLVILIAPDYNADGNERFSTDNRVAQNGPIGGVGIRENAQGLDLNRDYIKAEAPETQALLRLFSRWDPHLTVDLHTTDGSYHGYHLTYSIPLDPNTDANLAAYHRDKMMPALAEAMKSKHKFRTYYYGNFIGRAPAAGAPDNRSWQAFSPAPRVGTNYVGMRNRMAILSEAYSYLDFHGRVDVTEAFVEEIFNYSASHADEIRAVCSRADADAIAHGMDGPPAQFGIDSDFKALPDKVEILVGQVTKLQNPRSGRQMTAMVPDKFTPVQMLDYGMFAPRRFVPAAKAYLFPAGPGSRQIIVNLQLHGVIVEELTQPLKTEVQSFVIRVVTHAARPFQGHSETQLTGEYRSETAEYPTGTLLVRCAQSLGPLASNLLEPESDDGLTTWNFVDSSLKPGNVHPIRRLTNAITASSRLREH